MSTMPATPAQGHEARPRAAAPSVRYPHVHVPLSGHDGNAFSILGRVQSALLLSGIARAEAERFVVEATDGDYSDLLTTVQRWVSTC